MPVCNARPYLRQAVDSILGQTFTAFEFHIVDDGSDDGSEQILREYASRDPRIVLHRFAHRRGIVEALNTGCHASVAPLIARMDADDEAMPERLERQVAYLDAHEDIGVLGASVEVMDEQGASTSIWPRPCNPGLTAWSLAFACQLVHPSVMMRRTVLDACGSYTDGYMPGQDYKLWLQAAKVTRVTNLPDVLLRYRVRASSVSHASELASDEAGRRAWREEFAPLLGGDVTEEDICLLRGMALHRYPGSKVDLKRTGALIERLRRVLRTLAPLDSRDRTAVDRDAAVRFLILGADRKSVV